MKTYGKCPSCDKAIDSVIVQTINASTQLVGGNSFTVLCYQCPSCSIILSVQDDPGQLIKSIVRELRAK